MTDQKIPELRIGMRSGLWCAAVADQFGWVSLGTAYPLADEDVADWTPLAALPAPPAEASRPTTQGAARALLQLIRDTYRAGNSDLTYDPEDLANEFLERYRITRRVEA
ncbi:hypothetical protein [Amycolatopsis palatopharyngis]|uniref:hypothetical protein n=1 Tax=Amycolatopsis palatopharyngis TaxID=187982 RepID=UPI000E24A6CF|nr:hypothetical protein [Amycolatopsis palatopharyngis]